MKTRKELFLDFVRTQFTEQSPSDHAEVINYCMENFSDLLYNEYLESMGMEAEDGIYKFYESDQPYNKSEIIAEFGEEFYLILAPLFYNMTEYARFTGLEESEGFKKF